jgi:hypothetical protein
MQIRTLLLRGSKRMRSILPMRACSLKFIEFEKCLITVKLPSSNICIKNDGNYK